MRARRIVERLEIHHTPKHGSWLNMAEIELSVLAGQCLDRRIGTREELEREVTAWEKDRNERMVGVNWRFTTADARIKLRHLYPATQPGRSTSPVAWVDRIPMSHHTAFCKIRSGDIYK